MEGSGTMEVTPKTLGTRHVDRLRQLAYGQTHWLGRYIMPFLAASLVTSLLILVRQYLMVFWPTIVIPRWLVAFGLIVALESIYITGMHQRMRTPITLRLLEFVLVMGITYSLLRLDGFGKGYSFFSTSLRHDKMTLVPTMAMASVWLLARGYGQTFVWLGDIGRDVGDQGAATFSWETESLLSEYRVSRDRARAMGYFTRRFLFYGLIVGASGAVCVESYADRVAMLPSWSLTSNLAVIGFLLTGLLLQASVYLYRLQVIWEEVGIKADHRLPRQWLRSSMGFVLLVVILAILVPTIFSPLDIARTMETLGTWIGKGLDFALPGREATGPSTYGPTGDRSGSMENIGPSWLVGLFYLLMSLLMALSVAGIMLAIIGMLLFAFFQEEWERFHGLLRIPIFAYLWLKATITHIVKMCSTGLRRGKTLWERRARFSSTDSEYISTSSLRQRLAPSAPSLYIRHLFISLIEVFSAQGMGPKKSETALEYTSGMGDKLEGAQTEIHQLTEFYLLARYSAQEFSKDVKPVVRALWDVIVASFHEWLNDEK